MCGADTHPGGEVTGAPGYNAAHKVLEDARVLVFSNYASGEEAYQAFKAGACGFVVKEMPLERLLEAIRKVHQGEQYIPPEISTRMSGRVLSPLSPREMEVALLLTRGLRQEDIARRLSLSAKTVNTHKTRLFDKLEIRDSIALARLATQFGLADPAHAI